MNINRRKKYSIYFVLVFVSVGFIFYVYPLPSFKPYSKIILAKDGALLTAFLTPDDKWRMRTVLDEVSPDLIQAIIEKEDRWFYWHPGINIFSIARALYSNIVSGETVSGASTITMQLARILEPGDRTYWNKFLEILRAVQIELHFSKDEILEMYLSYLPMGGNIEGVKSAAYIYFDRPPSKLSLAQSIMLAVLPNDPNKLRLDIPSEYALQFRNSWINKFKSLETFPEEDLTDALDEPLTFNRYAVPSLAPHFTLEAARKTDEDIFTSSLDLNVQITAEKLLKNHVNRVAGKGVTNGAVLIIDNSNVTVAGYCGSVDFNDASVSGQVNGITSVRSPGSTLKPFLYAQALNNGTFTPQMKLLDIPTDFGGYLPENYDLIFNGDVTFEYALVNSLNVPAVRLLQNVGYYDFISLLKRGGFRDIIRRENQLGLSVILGGCGVTLEELTRFFTVFAKGGKLYKLNYENSTQQDVGSSIYYPETCYIISEILRNNERPDFPNLNLDEYSQLSQTTKLPVIAWKTGTSYGKRDAWAVGYNPDYTIGVWMGNFDGRGSPHLSGAEMSVPLLFDLFNAIDYEPEKKWFDDPEGLSKRKVCKDSGLLLNELCDDTTDDYYIKNVSQNSRCEISKEIYVNEKETIEYCPDCLPNSGYKKKVYKFYQPELALWFDENNIQHESPPLHNPECTVKFATGAPVIISPSAEFEYLIEENSKQQIKFQAASDASVKFHYWYVNDEFIGRKISGEKLFHSLKAGENKIVCQDDKGRTAELLIRVKYY